MDTIIITACLLICVEQCPIHLHPHQKEIFEVISNLGSITADDNGRLYYSRQVLGPFFNMRMIPLTFSSNVKKKKKKSKGGTAIRFIHSF